MADTQLKGIRVSLRTPCSLSYGLLVIHLSLIPRLLVQFHAVCLPDG